MLFELEAYLTLENIYLWSNFFVIPFWLLLAFAPSSKVTQIFVNSVILPLILATSYVYVIYQIILIDEPIFNFFRLYLSLDDLYTVLSSESFLVVVWLHFVSLNLFLGSWIASDGVKYGVPKSLDFVPLVIVYFTGPVGLVLYWFFRIFYAKKLNFHD